MIPLSYQHNGNGQVLNLSDEIGPALIRTKLIDRKVQETDGVELEKAKVIVAGGGGIGSKDGFEGIKELARVLGGAIGATRVPVDEKWVPHSVEIGQTGKIVNPDLYIAIGISGATQHVTGILGSKHIVAINKDPDANIFRVSDLGVIADYRELVPRLIETLKALGR